MALSQRRRLAPERELFGSALVIGRSEQETRTLVEQAFPLVDPAGVRFRLWPPGPGIAGDSSPEALLAGIRHLKHDLVIKAIHSSEGRTGVAVDPLDSQLIRQCPCPVWLADVTRRRPLRRVLAAVNPVVDDRAEQAGHVLRVAAAVAGAAGAELHVVHAWVAYGETLLRPRIPPHQLEAYVDGEREAATLRVDRSLAAARLKVPAARVHLPQGHFHRVLPDLIARERIDLVVLGTRGRSAWSARALLRPYPEVVLRHVGTPLLIVKNSDSNPRPAGW